MHERRRLRPRDVQRHVDDVGPTRRRPAPSSRRRRGCSSPRDRRRCRSRPAARSLPAIDAISAATSATWIRWTNENPSPGTRIGRPASRRAKKIGSRDASGLIGPSVWATRSIVAGKPVRRRAEPEEVLLAADLADAVGLAGIGVGGVVGAERLQHRLHEAAPVDRRRAREHEVLDAPGEQLDHRLEVGDVVGRVVVDDVELVAVRPERRGQRARHAAVAVDPAHLRRDVRLVAVDDRHVVAAPRPAPAAGATRCSGCRP